MSLGRTRILRVALSSALALAAAALLLIAAARFHDGPLGPLPGGALRAGALVPAPRDWTPWSEGQTLEIETRPESPWSVTTWFVVLDGQLHASADFLNPGKRWPHFAVRDPRVVLRLHDARGVPQRFAGHAARVVEPVRIAALRDAFARKYALAPGGLAARAEVWFFRIDAR